MKKYTITTYSSKTEEVTKERYTEHVRQKLQRSNEKILIDKSKVAKAKAKIKLQEISYNDILNEMQALVGFEATLKEIKYNDWAFEEQHPRESKLLREQI